MTIFSPTQKNNNKNLTFNEALELLIKGNKIHKLEWKNRSYYGRLVNQVLKIHKPDGKFYDWVLSYGDLTGDDYIVI
jgi:hypothetical protein